MFSYFWYYWWGQSTSFQTFPIKTLIPSVFFDVTYAVLLVAESLGGVLFAELLYYRDGRLKQNNKEI